MRLVLDAGGLSMLAGHRARLLALRERGLWPPQVPAVVLAEALTGDHRRDHAVNRLLRSCVVRQVDEPVARTAARLRTATGRAGQISATDAVVAALAQHAPETIVLTSDPDDLSALSHVADRAFTVLAA